MRRPLLAITSGFALLLVVAACGGKSKGGATALWSADPMALENPWPSDRLLSGGRAGTPPGYFTRVLPDQTQFTAARAFLDAATLAIASNGGYSVYAPVLVRLSAQVDTAGMLGIHLYPAAGGTDVTVTLRWSEALGALEVTPQAPLAAKTTYVLSVAGDGISPSGAFAAALKSDPALGALADAAVARGAAPAGSQIDLLTTFTTQPIADDLVAAQARIDGFLGSALLPSFSAPPGDLDFTGGYFAAGTAGFTAAFDAANAGTSGLAAIAQGSWNAYEFRGANDLFDRSLLVTSGATPATTSVDFRLCVPAGPVPTNGWPIVITSHGLTSDAAEAVARCSSFAKAGIAVIGLTATDHGYRGSFLHFFDFTRLLAVRDEFRQSDAEILELQRLLVNAKTQGIAPFDQLDAAHPHYWGNSLGALFGGAAIASSSHFEASGLSVPGGRLTRLFEGSAGSFLLSLFAGNVGLSTTDKKFPGFLDAFRIVAQMAIDPADPGALAPTTPASRPVLLQEALGDDTILNAATEDLRDAYGFPIYTAPSDPFSGKGAMWIWDKSQYPQVPADENPHNLYWDCKQMRHQMEDWINSDGMRLTNPAN